MEANWTFFTSSIICACHEFGLVGALLEEDIDNDSADDSVIWCRDDSSSSDMVLSYMFVCACAGKYKVAEDEDDSFSFFELADLEDNVPAMLLKKPRGDIMAANWAGAFIFRVLRVRDLAVVGGLVSETFVGEVVSVKKINSCRRYFKKSVNHISKITQNHQKITKSNTSMSDRYCFAFVCTRSKWRAIRSEGTKGLSSQSVLSSSSKMSSNFSIVDK